MTGIFFALICWIVWFFPETWVNLLEFDHSAIAAGQLWRLWSGHVTHTSWQQLTADSSVVAILGYIVQRHTKVMHLLILFITAPPLMSMLLFWLVPEMHDYRGASAVGAMLWVMAACQMLVCSRRYSMRFWFCALFLFILVAKVAGEGFFNMQPISAMSNNVHVVWEAHLFGAVIGFIGFLIIQFTSGGPEQSDLRSQARAQLNRPKPEKAS